MSKKQAANSLDRLRDFFKSKLSGVKNG